MRWGYHPWETDATGRSIRDYYDACVRMVRADYCGDGRGWTRTGMAIDVFDDIGIQVAETRGDPGFSFEAGWTPGRAVCVAHTRVPENIDPGAAQIDLSATRSRIGNCDESTRVPAGALSTIARTESGYA